MTDYIRNLQYQPLEWEDKVVDSGTGETLVPGTPVNEVNLNRIESGMLVSHYDVGLAAMSALQQAQSATDEILKYKTQRFLQGQATIVNESSATYFRSANPFVTVGIPGLPQINAPHYDVLVTVVSSDDMGRVGNLEVYDKTQNGFKIRMTGSAANAVVIWTLVNPNV